MNTVLAITQIILSVILIIAILIQHSENGLGETFGGGDGVSSVSTRRGVEKKVFQATIILAVAFVVLSFVVFVIS